MMLTFAEAFRSDNGTLGFAAITGGSGCLEVGWVVSMDKEGGSRGAIRLFSVAI